MLSRAAPTISRSIRALCCAYLIERRDGLADAFVKSVTAGSGTLTSFAIRAVDGEELLSIAARHFISIQIPDLIDKNAEKIDTLIGNLLKQLAAIIQSPRFTERFLSLDWNTIKEFVYAAAGDERVAGAAADTLAGVLSDIFNGVTVRGAAALFKMDDAHEFAMRADTLIRCAADALTEGARIEAEDLARAASDYLSKIAVTAGYQLCVSDIFGGATSGDFTLISDLLQNAFLNPVRIDALWKRCVATVLAENRAALRLLISDIINSALDEQDERAFAGVIAEFLSRVDGGFDIIWESGISKNAVRVLSAAGAGALSAGMGGVIRAVDLQSVAEERINAMDTRGIERLFLSFAGRYIRRIKLYGLWGGVSGIHPALPAASAVIALIAGITSKVRRRRSG